MLRRIEIRIASGKNSRRVEIVYLFGVKIYEYEVFYEDATFFTGRSRP